MPDGGLKVIRGPQPKSERWPHRQSVAHQDVRQRPGSVASGQRQEPLDPDAMLAHAKARVCQLGGGNAGGWRVRSDIPGIARCHETRTCPSGVATSPGPHQRHGNFFAEGKETGGERSSGSGEGQSRVVFGRLHQENESIVQAEDRLRVLREEADGVRVSVPPPTAPCVFAQELVQLRVSVHELMREWDQLRIALARVVRKDVQGSADRWPSLQQILRFL